MFAFQNILSSFSKVDPANVRKRHDQPHIQIYFAHVRHKSMTPAFLYLRKRPEHAMQKQQLHHNFPLPNLEYAELRSPRRKSSRTPKIMYLDTGQSSALLIEQQTRVLTHNQELPIAKASIRDDDDY